MRGTEKVSIVRVWSFFDYTPDLDLHAQYATCCGEICHHGRPVVRPQSQILVGKVEGLQAPKESSAQTRWIVRPIDACAHCGPCDPAELQT